MRFALLCLLLIFAFNAQSPSQKARPTRPNPPTVSYVNQPFDLATTKMPPDFKGADPEAIFTAIDKRREKAVKGEFETTAEFNARLEAERNGRLVGDVRPDSLIAIAVEEVDTKYDADTKVLQVSVKLGEVWDGIHLDESARSIKAKTIFLPTETYEASNAYGAKAVVEKHSSMLYQLKVKNYKELSTKIDGGRYDREIVFDIPMEIQQAREAKSNVRALAAIALKEPSISKGYLRSKPTITNPKDIFAMYMYLVGDLRALIIYDSLSGQIYAARK